MLPKAEVMKEILIPRIFSEIVRGEAFYISVPKMKTNLYTGVTLGCVITSYSIHYTKLYESLVLTGAGLPELGCAVS